MAHSIGYCKDCPLHLMNVLQQSKWTLEDQNYVQRKLSRGLKPILHEWAEAKNVSNCFQAARQQWFGTAVEQAPEMSRWRQQQGNFLLTCKQRLY